MAALLALPIRVGHWRFLRRAGGVVFGLWLAAAVAGCSVAMALQGKEEPDLSAVEVGGSRRAIELQLGHPKGSEPNDLGGLTSSYSYLTGKDPSPGRAGLYLVLDLVTLGIWELIGTPLEYYQGRQAEIRVDYDHQDRAAVIRKLR